MTVLEIEAVFAAYPAIKNAIGWTELVVCDVDGIGSLPTTWDELMARRITPAAMADLIRHGADAEGEWGPIGMEVVRAEMQRPEFLTYIAGKMGAV